MKINGTHYRAIWLKEDDPTTLQAIDQRYLPHEFIIEDMRTVEEVARAIREMHLRGAPLIGSAAAYGMYLALLDPPEEKSRIGKYLQEIAQLLKETRPTAINLAYAVDRVLAAIEKEKEVAAMAREALQEAHNITEENVEQCRLIGQHGLALIQAISKKKKGKPVNILTHCNAGWLACIDYGTATAPIYAAHNAGIPVHVWVDETRPRNQGANITAFELLHQGIPHSVITDNTGGHLMQHGMVDLVLVGSDRTTRRGDVANKIGTYLKALAAKDNKVPFYVALPSSSFDFRLRDGLQEIPIEERNPDEVSYVYGWFNGKIYKVRISPQDSTATNYAFDVTPARLVTGLITERGVCRPSERGIFKLFPEAK
ncbi:MAG: S-methyl-5-thioribose-1-phosphate isomerase [Phaeodactylibacter sp.]|nr:S-methyl-5-thioribose-1-phosphate isomerase [Phaeodactylibacter sp.]MCB9301966.1 S-methyl-5-thioribose-1-phosphate isomerase [Lewinellaceae bacterium]HQU59993.1 S-methyl-5-thioribose-1-phosphate isomerase [Saprospiraceae bacterium]